MQIVLINPKKKKKLKLFCYIFIYIYIFINELEKKFISESSKKIN